MNKILWAVCGIGLGHARRSKLIAERIKADIKFVSYGAGHRFLGGIGVEGYDYRGKEAWSFLQNLFGIIKDFGKVKKSYEKIKRFASKFNPDLIVADTEPITVHYAKRNGRKYVLISNLPLVIDNYEELPVKNAPLRLQYRIVRRIEEYMESEASLVIVPSFKRRRKKKIVYCGPIAKRIEAEESDFIYVNVGGHDIEKRIMSYVIRHLKKLDAKFVIASNRLFKEYKKVGNLEIYPFVRSPEEYIARSKGVITTAGLTIIHEAMVSGKPIFAIPIPNHIEQITNAYLVEKNKLGESLIMEKLDKKVLLKMLEYFVESIEEYKVRKRGSGLNLAASQIEGFLHKS